MIRWLGATPAMKRSLTRFSGIDEFRTALLQTITKTQVEALLCASGASEIFYLKNKNLDVSTFIRFCESKFWFQQQDRGAPSEPYKILQSRDASALKTIALICDYNDIVILCNQWMGLDDSDGLILEVPQQAVPKNHTYTTVGDILADRNNFGKVIRDLTILLEDVDRWTISAEALLDAGIDVHIDQQAISQREMKGEFYLESIRGVKLTDFLPNIEFIGCESIATRIYDRLQELKANVIFKRKEAFAGKNEVANWCKLNDVSHLYDQLIGLGFDSLEKLKTMDDQTCTELGIKGFARISLMKKIKTIP